MNGLLQKSSVYLSVACKLTDPHFSDAQLKLDYMKSLLFLTITSFLSVSSIGQSAVDTESVKKVVIAFQEDFNEGSFKNASNYATVDWEHIGPYGGIWRGRDTLIKALRSIHQTVLKGVTMTIESMTVRFITSDVAIADVIHKSSPFELPPGVRHENMRQMKTYVVVKQSGKWLLTLDQNTIIQDLNLAQNSK